MEMEKNTSISLKDTIGNKGNKDNGLGEDKTNRNNSPESRVLIKEEPKEVFSEQANNGSEIDFGMNFVLNNHSEDSELILNVMHVDSSDLQVIEDLDTENVTRNDYRQKNAEIPQNASNEDKIAEQQVVNKNFICNLCNLHVESDAFYDHLKTHCSEKSCVCPLCQKTFKTKRSLLKHVQNHVKNYKFAVNATNESESDSNEIEEDEEFILAGLKSTDRRQCRYCNKVFRRRGHLECHERIHTGDKPYKCIHCDKAFARKDGLRLHEHVHSGVRPYKCKQCDKAFPRQSSLTEHERIHTGLRTYKCKQCNKAFLTDSHMRIHERTHTGEKPYNCARCNMSFARKTDLKRHEVSHTGAKPYRCIYCDKCFTRQNDVKRHELIHTGADKPYKCDDCGNAFTDDANLKSHKCGATTIKPHSCKHCNRGFTRRSDLKRHEQTHAGIKPFKCKYCDKAFTRQNDVKRHEIIHSGFKPYKCKYCDKAYTRRSYVMEHESVHTEVDS